MTDKLLCPFCNKPLQPTLRQSDEYWCENYDCPQTNIAWVGTSALWQALIDIKKKLDIAVDALKLFDSGQYTPQPDSYGLKTDASRLARKTMEQITALEQKDK